LCFSASHSKYVPFADEESVDILAVALQGTEQSQDRFNGASSQFASPRVLSGGTADTTDLSAAAAAMLSAKDDFEANLTAVKTADEMQRVAIDLRA
jgi:flagellar hook protein FlgE